MDKIDVDNYIIYKSQYSKACDIVGIQKPVTQEIENYCQLVEFEHPEMAANILSNMLGVKIKSEMFPNTYKKSILKIKSWIK